MKRRRGRVSVDDEGVEVEQATRGAPIEVRMWMREDSAQ